LGTRVRGRLIPPNLRTLLTDPIYRSYFLRPPAPVACQMIGQPWQVYVKTIVAGPEDVPEVRWRGGRFRTYADAFACAKRQLKAADDVVIVSRAVLYRPPDNFGWSPGLEWCGRCRRPTRYAVRRNHHALRGAPVLTDDEPYRCYYCGARRVFAGGFRAQWLA
jgi:hypothetical protein